MRFLIVAASVSALALATVQSPKLRNLPRALKPLRNLLRRLRRARVSDVMQREHASWFPSEDKIPYRPCPSSVLYLPTGHVCLGCPSVPVALLEVLHGAAVQRASSLAAGPNRALAREATVAVAAAEIGDSPQACETDWRNTMERIRQAEHARALSGFLANVSRFLGALKVDQVGCLEQRSHRRVIWAGGTG